MSQSGYPLDKQNLGELRGMDQRINDGCLRPVPFFFMRELNILNCAPRVSHFLPLFLSLGKSNSSRIFRLKQRTRKQIFLFRVLIVFGAYGGTRTHNFSLLRRTPLPIGTRKHWYLYRQISLRPTVGRSAHLFAANPSIHHYVSRHSHYSFGIGFYGFPPPGFRHASNYDSSRKSSST